MFQTCKDLSLDLQKSKTNGLVFLQDKIQDYQNAKQILLQTHSKSGVSVIQEAEKKNQIPSTPYHASVDNTNSSKKKNLFSLYA